MRKYAETLLSLQNLLRYLDGMSSGSKADRYAALVLAKRAESVLKKLIGKLDKEARANAKTGVRGENKTTSWVEDAVDVDNGRFVARQYDGKPGGPKVTSVDAVKDLLRPKSNIAIGQVVEKIEVVNIGRLVALVESGHLTQEELDSVTEVTMGSGSFSMVVEGQPKEMFEWNAEQLAAKLVEG
jgi:hypothetical protein